MTKEEINADDIKEYIEPVDDRYLRLLSDFDNFRKRTKKEKAELYKTAGEDVILAVIPILDDFERVIKSDYKNDKVIDLIYQKMKSNLEHKGLKTINAEISGNFDVDFHEAISQYPVDKPGLDGKIISVSETGYMLGDKVIRHTKVIVASYKE